MNHQRKCLGRDSATGCMENVYLWFEIAPIFISWGICLSVLLIFTCLRICLCCHQKSVSSLFPNQYCESDCEKCHCQSCGRLKCEKDGECICDDCSIIKNDTRHFKNCHQGTPEYECNECNVDPEKDSCRSKDLSDSSNCSARDETNSCRFSAKSCLCCCCAECWLKKLGVPFFTLGNIFVRFLFGGKLGLVREFPRKMLRDRYGQERMYIDNYSIPERSYCLHYMLTVKVLVFIAFWLATGSDILFVRSELGCDASRDCYILDGNYEDYPIVDCSDILDNPNVTGVCYNLVFDLSGAGSAMGGLLSTTFLETALIAYIIIYVYRFCCYQKRCYRKRRLRMCRIITFFVFLQVSFAIMTVAVVPVLYNFLGKTKKVSYLRKAGDWIKFSGYPLSIALSVLIPWQLLVDKKSNEDFETNPTNRTEVAVESGRLSETSPLVQSTTSHV